MADIDLPDCNCKVWARIFASHYTSHHPNCTYVLDELRRVGFLKVPNIEGNFACRVTSDSIARLYDNLISRNLEFESIPIKEYKDCKDIPSLKKTISDFYAKTAPEIDIKFLVIDRMLYVRYHDQSKFLLLEEYSYVEDEYETRKLYY